MRELPEHFDRIWKSGDFTGANRPFRRVTVQRPMMRTMAFQMRSTFSRAAVVPSPPGAQLELFNPYPDGINPNRGENVTNVYADYLFGAPEAPKELPNVASISWTRSVDQDAAEVKVELWNVDPLPIGGEPERDWSRLGSLTPTHGTSRFRKRWGHTKNEWHRQIMPDNILRTYEGWGSDAEGQEIGQPGYIPPERDTRLVQTGVWIIDEVNISALGRIVITARDTARLLMDHIAMAPVIPDSFYPVTYRGWGDAATVQSTATELKRLAVTHEGSGNDKWPQSAYPGAKVYGHSSTHAFDGKTETYYLSVGNASRAYRSAYEYVDIGVSGDVSQIRFRTVKSGYNAYVSIKGADGQWIDEGKTMPYHRDGRGRYEEGVPYVAYRGALSGEGEHMISLGNRRGVTLVRLWLGNLQDFGLPGQKYRAGIREVSLWGMVQSTRQRKVKLTPGPAGSNPGRVRDYTDIVKLACAWAGLFWPKSSRVLHSDGRAVTVRPRRSDMHALGKGAQGRVWGDFEKTGTAPVSEIGATNFDKKSLMDMVNYVRDVVGFLFYVDETGAAQWRQPNIWKEGNWLDRTQSLSGPTAVRSLLGAGVRTREFVTIDERQALTDLDVTLQSRDIREGIFVANPVGKYAALVSGYNPNYTGLRRVGGYSDEHFESKAEARAMAQLIAVRQMFKYRTDRMTIPANPAIQIDDQVRVYERVTSEGYFHYVAGISSTNSAETGLWNYQLSTNWLGDNPDGSWFFEPGENRHHSEVVEWRRVEGLELVEDGEG